VTDGPTGKRDFFVSFNRADRAWATWIAWVLEEAGYSVWFQDWDFRGNFVEHMNRAHAQAHRTLAVLSDHYFGSDFTLAEWSARLAQDPAAREDRLVPVKVGPLTGEWIGHPLVYADLTGCGEEEAQGRLLGRVKKALDAGYRDKPPTRPGFPGGPPRQVTERPAFPPAERRPTAAWDGEAAAPPLGPATARADRGGIAGGRDVSVRTSHGLSGLMVILLVLVVVGTVLLAGSLLGKRVTSSQGGVAIGGDVTGSSITGGAPIQPPPLANPAR
jgi:hypothetical protein